MTLWQWALFCVFVVVFIGSAFFMWALDGDNRRKKR